MRAEGSGLGFWAKGSWAVGFEGSGSGLGRSTRKGLEKQSTPQTKVMLGPECLDCAFLGGETKCNDVGNERKP